MDYAPHSALFPHASLIVHHGGIGTSAEALRAGKPMLVVPHGFDQPDNAARLQRLGVAEVLPAGRYRHDRAASLLARLDEDRGYRTNAEPVARVLREEDGAETAAGVIEKFCDASRGFIDVQ